MAIVDFNEPTLNAEPCSFGFQLPSFSFGFQLPSAGSLGFSIPVPRFKLAISCDLSKPIDISVGLSSGGGRGSNADPCPDDDESF